MFRRRVDRGERSDRSQAGNELGFRSRPRLLLHVPERSDRGELRDSTGRGPRDPSHRRWRRRRIARALHAVGIPVWVVALDPKTDDAIDNRALARQGFRQRFGVRLPQALRHDLAQPVPGRTGQYDEAPRPHHAVVGRPHREQIGGETTGTARRAYLDASALVKLVVHEAESEALRADLHGRSSLVTSRLGVVEAERAIRRTTTPPFAEMRVVFETVDVVEVSPSLMAQAGSLTPVALRTLDAIHLATLLLLGAADLDAVTYDDRLVAAARQHGFTVVQPAPDPATSPAARNASSHGGEGPVRD